MVIFHSYVKLPEGNPANFDCYLCFDEARYLRLAMQPTTWPKAGMSPGQCRSQLPWGYLKGNKSDITKN